MGKISCEPLPGDYPHGILYDPPWVDYNAVASAGPDPIQYLPDDE